MQPCIDATNADLQELMKLVQRGDTDAAISLFQRCYTPLYRQLRSQIAARVRPKFDADDVLQSVFRSFFARSQTGRLTVDNWDSLWGLLWVMARRKLGRRLKYHAAARRDVNRELPIAATGDYECEVESLASPDGIAAVKEIIDLLSAALSERDRAILELHLAFYTAVEISERLGCATRTVRRSLVRIRQQLHVLLDGHE